MSKLAAVITNNEGKQHFILVDEVLYTTSYDNGTTIVFKNGQRLSILSNPTEVVKALMEAQHQPAQAKQYQPDVHRTSYICAGCKARKEVLRDVTDSWGYPNKCSCGYTTLVHGLYIDPDA